MEVLEIDYFNNSVDLISKNLVICIQSIADDEEIISSLNLQKN